MAKGSTAPSPAIEAPGQDGQPAPRLTGLLETAASEPGLRKGERTRRRIIWASAVALEQTPFALLSMDRIAEIASVSRAALYQYVASKEEAARLVLLALQDLTLTMPSGGASARSPLEAIVATNRYYIDYFEKNAVFMERVRELRETLPGLMAEKQRVNRRWAERVLAHAVRHRPSPLDPARLKLRVFAMECMVDDVLREIFVIRNPDIIEAAADREMLIQELSAIWFKALYDAD
ncbi:TetR/AcrR family transcriptional regulator [Bosea sp. LjRoot237]|uniref:TetR/AcrR family transcriptional regulator n=1 Tax=Bosea sp. LjRoot237 TaxID=3342292 RepID=UPI003ED116D4